MPVSRTTVMTLTLALCCAVALGLLTTIAQRSEKSHSPVQVQAGAGAPPRNEVEAVVKDYLARNPEIVHTIVKDYLTRNPDLLQDAIETYVKQRAANRTAGTDKADVVKANAAQLFSSPRQVTLGNPRGDVTLVEFFDYNCGFCRRAAGDKLELIKSDPRLKVVLKELPVLGPGSREAAEVAVAVRMQDPGGTKYAAFHQRMMSHRGQANRAVAIEAAGAVGIDLGRLETDMSSAEIKETIEESRRLARALGISGTPSYVVGTRVVAGAIGKAELEKRIAEARKQ